MTEPPESAAAQRFHLADQIVQAMREQHADRPCTEVIDRHDLRILAVGTGPPGHISSGTRSCAIPSTMHLSVVVPRHRGTAKVGWMFEFTAAAYKLVRIRRLLPVATFRATA